MDWLSLETHMAGAEGKIFWHFDDLGRWKLPFPESFMTINVFESR